MKGHTKIELTDVNTGEVEVIEDDNMLTNALSIILKPRVGITPRIISGDASSSSLFGYNWHFAILHFGGLLLFDKPLEENPDNIVPPDGVVMTACAACNYAGTATPEVGIFNSQESEFKLEGSSVSMKFVYEFSTTQGNGRIASVCLGSLGAGLRGFGNPSLQSGNNYPVTMADKSTTTLLTRRTYEEFQFTDFMNIKNKFIILGSNTLNTITDGIILSNNNIFIGSRMSERRDKTLGIFTSQSINFYKYYIPTNSLNPLVNGSRLFSTYSNNLGLPLIDTISVEIPDELKQFSSISNEYLNYAHSMITNEDGFWIIVCKDASSNYPIGAYINSTSYNMVCTGGDTIYLWHIGTDLITKRVYTITVPENIDLIAPIREQSKSFAIYDGYLYLSGANGNYAKTNSSGTSNVSYTAKCPGIYRFELNNLTNVELVKNSDKLKNITHYNNFVYYFGRLVCQRYNQYDINIIDSVNNTILPMNGYFAPIGYYYRVSSTYYDVIYITVVDDSKSICAYFSYTDASNNRFINYLIQTEYLSTINNLDSPVIKTADKTMKVTYTLTGSLDEI